MENNLYAKVDFVYPNKREFIKIIFLKYSPCLNYNENSFDLFQFTVLYNF